MEIARGVQIVIAVLLVTSILLQARGTGIGSTFGGGGELYRTKRGLERLLFTVTIILAALFAVSSLLNVVIG